MRLIFSILTAIVVLIAGLVFIVPMFISTDELRSELFARMESMTGYRLRVSGPLDLTVFPSIALVAEDVGLAQPTGSGDAEFATAKKVRFDLMLRDLFQGKVRVREVTLINPVVAVPQSNPATAPAQQAPPATPQGAVPGAPQPSPAPAGGGSGMAAFAEQLKTITLDKLIIQNGTVTLPPSGGKPGKRIEQLNLNASLPGYDAPLLLETKAVIDGKRIELNASIGNFGPFLSGATVPVRIKANVPDTLDAPVSMSGAASYKNDTFTLSQFSAKSGDKTLSGTAVYKDTTATLSQFTATVGRDTFAGNAVYKDNVVAINPLRANVRGTVLAGQVQANLANKTPYVVAALSAKTINVNAMKGGGKSKPSKGSGGAASGGGGQKANAGWSNEKIDFSVLKAVNGKFNITAQQLIYDQVKIQPIALQATLNGGKLNATLSQFGLYGGAGNASIAVDTSGKTPTQRVNVSLVNFDGYTFLKDAAALEKIEGKGTVSFDLGAVGASQRAMVRSLGGNAKIEFTNGAIRGVNVAKMIRNLGNGAINGWQGSVAEKTDFASLGATFQIAKGQATTKDIHLVGPLVRVNGAGTVNIPKKSLKLRVDPQLVASLEGQGAQNQASGFGVPVMIVGPWAKPKIYPDIKGILENPAEAIARYKQFGKELKDIPGLGGNADALSNVIKDGKVDQDALIQGIGGLLGGGQAAPQPNAVAVPDGTAAVAPDAQAAPAAPLSNVIKDGKVDQDALIQGIGGLLGGGQAAPQPNAAPAPNAQAAPADATTQNRKPAKKKKKKKLKAEDVGKQLLNNWLSGQ